MGLGIYVHIPFCAAKCAYCDFFSLPDESGLVDGYLKALAAETKIAARVLGDTEMAARISSLYIGGGTPTILTGDQLAGVIGEVSRVFPLAEDCEITVEANPGTIDREKLQAVAAAGVSRLSLGAQSLDPTLLRSMGRIHGRREIDSAFDLARELRLAVNIDLIYAFPGQTPEIWKQTLREVTEMAPEHISAYALKVEEGTPLAFEIASGTTVPCPEEVDAAMYEEAVSMLTSQGYQHYEISNFARPGCQSRHNRNYWENGDYIGLGAGAHSHRYHRRWANTTDLKLYADTIACGKLPVSETDDISPAQEMSETMFLGLRLVEGLSLTAFHRRFGISVETVFGKAVSKHISTGLLTCQDGKLSLTRRGLLLANEVFVDFL